jgi:rRNA maturation protein Rpf1
MEKYKVILTTSRRPNRRIRAFVKDLADVIPNSIRLTRGHLTMKDLWYEAVSQGAKRVIIVADKRGNPGIIRVYTPAEEQEELVNIVSFIVKGVSLARERGAPSPSHASRKAKRLKIFHSSECGVCREFARALEISFGAVYSPNPPGTDDSSALYLVLTPIDERTVEVEFKYLNYSVGPRLKLGKPAQMIKNVEGVLNA